MKDEGWKGSNDSREDRLSQEIDLIAAVTGWTPERAHFVFIMTPELWGPEPWKPADVVWKHEISALNPVHSRLALDAFRDSLRHVEGVVPTKGLLQGLAFDPHSAKTYAAKERGRLQAALRRVSKEAASTEGEAHVTAERETAKLKGKLRSATLREERAAREEEDETRRAIERRRRIEAKRAALMEYLDQPDDLPHGI